MNPESFCGCVVIPTYNSGSLLVETVREALTHWRPVIVVVDGSYDGSAEAIADFSRNAEGLHVLTSAVNGGKGAAVLSGLEFAAARGFSHAAVFDADGQHEAADIPHFMDAARTHPGAMILGVPVFGRDAPSVRVNGRRVGNWFANLETWWGGVNDSLFGFRVYPVRPSIDILRAIRGGRRFDFDTQLAVRLYWRGVQPLNIPTRVRYRAREAGGVSHFRYVRDNALLAWVHALLFFKSLMIAPRLARLRRRPPLEFHSCNKSHPGVEA